MTDYLTCGECLKEFPLQKITLFIQHKKLDCGDDGGENMSDPELQCNFCPQGFMTAWGLLIHAQISHNLKIFLENASRTLLRGSKLSTTHLEVPSAFSESITKPCLQLQPVSNYSEAVGKAVPGNENTTESAAVDSSTIQIPSSPLKAVCPPVKDAQHGPTIAVSQCSTSGVKVIQGIDTTSTNRQLITSDVHLGVGKSSPDRDGTHTQGAPQTKDTSLSPTLGTNAQSLQSSPIAHSGQCPISTVQASLENQELGALSSAVLSIPTLQHSGSPSSDKVGIRQIEDDSAKLKGSKKDANESAILKVLGKDANKSTILEGVKKSGEETATAVSSPDISNPSSLESIEKAADENTAMLDDGSKCCDNQGCGVTVIPGTHQDLQKCCNAVVPKMRKRHMQMKHMSSYPWGSNRYTRRRLLNRAVASSMKPVAASLTKSSSIFIEVEPDSSMLDKHSNSDNNNGSGGTGVDVAGVTVSTEPLTSLSGSSTATEIQTLTGADTKPKSLILKPGAIFSIPFTYTIPMTSGMSSFRFSPTVSTVTSGVGGRGAMLPSTPVRQGGGRGGSGQPDGAVDTPPSTTQATPRGPRSLKPGDRPTKYSTSKPFSCDTCTMSFNQRIHLKKHVMSKHTGNKPFKCGECDYSTVERSHLKVHIRIHTGEKPFKCTYCEYATAQNSTLKIHLKRHHGGRMFHCGSCEKEFTQEQQLRGHETEHGGDITDSPDSKTAEQNLVSPVTQTSPLPGIETVLQGTDHQSNSSCMGDHSTSPSLTQTSQSALPASPAPLHEPSDGR